MFLHFVIMKNNVVANIYKKYSKSVMQLNIMT